MTATKQRRRNRRRGGGSGAPPSMPAAPAAPPKPGLFANRYKIERQIGRGMMKRVFLARDTFTGNTVAIGVFHESGRPSTRFIERYNAVRDCGPHPTIAQVLDAGIAHDRDGTLLTYIAMEYVEHAELAALAVLTTGQPLRTSAVLLYTHGVLSGLAHLHAHGRCHGAPHAQNVMIDRAGRPVIIDHDWTLPPGTTRIQPTELVDVIGMHQVVPEQLLGKPYDERSDLYTAGIGAYVMAVGRFPFAIGSAPVKDGSADFVSRLDRLPATPIKRNPLLPQQVSDLLLKLLTPSPDHRPQSAADALDELEQIPFPFPRYT